MKIAIKRGLDLPLSGKPEGSVRPLLKPKKLALNLNPFGDLRFKLLIKEGDVVQIGQPLVENKALPNQFFVSPAAGVVKEIRRGAKRRLIDIVIEVAEKETHFSHNPLNPSAASREEILDAFMKRGLFAHIRLRPFNLIANPKWIPRDIFVRAIETLPFVPAAEMQLKGHESAFQAGLDVLSKLTCGKVHLVSKEGSPFSQFERVEKHTASGPHPAGTSSLHIHKISPIKHPQDYVWTLSALDVIVIGTMMTKGIYFTDRILSCAAEGICEPNRGFFQGRQGFAIEDLIEGNLSFKPLRLISGDPLTGVQVTRDDFLGFNDTAFCAIAENTERELFHFFRAGFNKYTATRTYGSGFVKPPEKGYSFTTNQHGEERPFIDSEVYDRVMPMRIPTVQLIKAILAEDYELAEQLGLLEVAPEDFALATFICPSKIEMMQIVESGLHFYSKEMGH